MPDSPKLPRLFVERYIEDAAGERWRVHDPASPAEVLSAARAHLDLEAAAAWFLDLVAKADEAGITLAGLATQTSHLIVPGILSRALGIEVLPPSPVIDEEELRRIEEAITALALDEEAT